MAFSARMFRILIASPSDVVGERSIIVETIQSWNDLNSAERQVVLLPIRWERQSAPEYGQRPQEILNRQVVDYCDLLVGIFWTKIGSPTGVAESGTLEEIERAASSGKTVMLYFSQIKKDPYEIDLEQLKKLRDFRNKTLPNALVGTYSSQIEFRDKLARELEIQIRSLLAKEAGETDGSTASKSGTDIQLHFADPETGRDAGKALTLEVSYIEVEDVGRIPDYEESKERKQEKPKNALGELSGLIWDEVNKDYYRERAAYLVEANLFRRVRFWLKNTGSVGARDVHIDIHIRAVGGEALVASPSDMKSPPSIRNNQFRLDFGSGDSVQKPMRIGDAWQTSFEIPALQPQREISPRSQLVIGATENCRAILQAHIYADTLPKPILQELSIDLKVKRVTVNADQLLSAEPKQSEAVEGK